MAEEEFQEQSSVKTETEKEQSAVEKKKAKEQSATEKENHFNSSSNINPPFRI